MCHNLREWHQDVIRKIKMLNQEKGYSVSVMIDTEGNQIQVVDHCSSSSVKAEVINQILLTVQVVLSFLLYNIAGFVSLVVAKFYPL